MTTQLTTTPPPAPLAAITQQNGLSVESAKLVIEAFAPLYLSAFELVKAGKAFEVKDANDKEGMAKARAMRLKLRQVRCEAENVRKTLKEESLRYGKAIDRVAHVVKDMIEPVEAELLEQEQIAERLEAFRKAELKRVREAELRPLGADVSQYPLGEMTEEAYRMLLDLCTTQHQQRVEAAKKAEEERKAAEAKRAEEEARVRAENERLRKEREEADARAKADREAREKAEAELQQKREEEARRQLEDAARVNREEEARKRAERAPDKEKLLSLAMELDSILMPLSVSSVEGESLFFDVKGRISALARYIREKAGAL